MHHKRYVWTVEVKYDGPLTRTGEAVFWTWWAHASQGGTFTLAHDTNKDTLSTLSSGAVAAQAVVPTTTTTNYAAGDLVILEKADRSYFEVGIVQSVSAATSVTLTANLKQTFATGDVLRHFDYHPSMCALTSNCPLQLQSFGDANFMQLQVKCTEVL